MTEEVLPRGVQKLDELARELRLAYADAEPRVNAHVERMPWESLDEHRKAKWRAMAWRATQVIEGWLADA